MNQAQLKVGAIVRNKYDSANLRRITQIQGGMVTYQYTLDGSLNFNENKTNMSIASEFVNDNEFIRQEDDFYADQNKLSDPKSRSKYNRDLIALGGEKVQADVYRVLDAFGVTDPHLQHAAKKILCAGQRGHKDLMTDLDDIIDSVQKAKVMESQK